MTTENTRLDELARRFVVDTPPPRPSVLPRVTVRRTLDRSIGNWPDRASDVRAEIAHLERCAPTDFTAGAICALRWVLREGGAPCNQ